MKSLLSYIISLTSSCMVSVSTFGAHPSTTEPSIIVPPNMSLRDTISQNSDSVLNNHELEEVVVTAQLPYTKIKGTNLIIDVDRSPWSDLPTSTDIIKQLPFIKETGSGYEILGRGKAIIYIDNHKVNDFSEITRLQPSAIKSIELIRYPGAQYDSDASAIIKILLKRKIFDGLGIDARTSVSAGRRVSDYEQLSLSYGINDIVFYLNATNNSYRASSDQINHQDIYTSASTWRMISDMPKWKSEYYDWSVNGGASLNICTNHNIGGIITYSHDNSRSDGGKHSTMNVDNSSHEILSAWTNNTQGYKQFQANVFYDGTLSDKLLITFNGDYVNRKSNSIHITQEKGNLTTLHNVTNYGHNEYDLWSGIIKSEWTLNKISKFSIGCNGSIVTQKSNTLQNDPKQQSILDSKDAKYALFGQFDFSYKQWNINIGLRYETFRMKYEEGEKHLALLDKKYNHMYPDLTISTSFGKTTMALGFNSRVKRPTFHQLRNSSEYFNKYEITIGNPFLMPTYTHELSYAFQYENLTVNTGFKWIKNYITEESEIESSNPLHILTQPVNIPNYTDLTLSANYNKKIGFWSGYLSAYLSKTFYNFITDYKYPSKLRKVPYFEMTMSNYFTFLGTTAYISLNYNPAGSICNYWEHSNLNFDAGLYRRFLKKQLYIAIQATNIFGSMLKSKTYTKCTTFERISFRDNQRIILTVSYNFKHNTKYRGKVSAQDEINRM